MSGVCPPTIGVSDASRIPDSFLAPASFSPGNEARFGRLNTPDNSWCTSEVDDPAMRIFTINLSGKPSSILGIATQGHPLENHWVKRFEIRIGMRSWTVTGNTDHNTTITNMFHSSGVTEMVEIIPVDWEGNKICMRMELIGINDGENFILFFNFYDFIYLYIKVDKEKYNVWCDRLTFSRPDKFRKRSKTSYMSFFSHLCNTSARISSCCRCATK